MDPFLITRSPGVVVSSFRFFRRIIERLDSKLAQHLQNHDVEFLQFSFRWFNCLLIRELSLPCSLRLWDTYVAEKVRLAAKSFKSEENSVHSRFRIPQASIYAVH